MDAVRWLLAGLLTLVGTTVNAQFDEKLAGTYSLQGAMEMAAVLVLHPDHRFRFSQAYGGTTQSATGTWAVSGDVVTLTTGPLPAPGFVWGGSLSEYEGAPERPVVLVVQVKSPEYDLYWRNMDVKVAFSNGQTRGGLTGYRGLLAFEDRQDGEWRSAKPVRVGVSYPRYEVPEHWFDVPPGTKTAVIEFKPGRLLKPAFTEMRLMVQDEYGALVLSPAVKKGGLPGSFIRQGGD